MNWLSPGLQVVYPDGKKRNRPKDGERWIYGGDSYTWDDVIGKWSNWSGNIVEFDEKKDDIASLYDPNYFSGEYGYGSTYKKEEPQKEEKPRSEGDKLRDFFFPKNTLGCECGTWLTNSNRHSKHCKLYREEE